MTIKPKLQNSEECEQSKALLHSENENIIPKDSLQILLESFRRVIAIGDPVSQEYEITKEARLLDVPLEGYRRMFETYRKPKKNPSKFDKVIKPVSMADKKVGDFIAWFQSISLFKLTAVFSQVTLLLAIISFFFDAPRRQQQAIDAARLSVESASKQIHSKARIRALKTLNQFCVSLTGLNAANANLKGIELNQCYVENEFSKMFATWPPQFFKYQGFDLSYADLQNANLNGANLEGANLRGVNLQGAHLIETNLKGANLEGANLEGAKVWRVNLAGANLQNSNLKNSGLGRANLQGVNFQGANLAGAKLYWSDIRESNFSRSNLEGTNLSRTKLQGSDFYKANLKGAYLRHADLRDGVNFRNTELQSANLENAKFGSIYQLKRAKNWEKAVKSPNWEAQITQPIEKKFRIGLIKFGTGTAGLFNSYQKGMELAAVGEKVEIVFLSVGVGVEEENKVIKKIIDDGIDAIVLLPQDNKKSVNMIKEAYESGAAVFNVGSCINEEDANKYLFGCYGSNRYQIGYDSANYLVKWAAENLPEKDVNLAVFDSTSTHSISYPTLKGFYMGIQASNVPWHEVISANIDLPSNLSEAKEILTNNPKINIIWGGSNSSTALAVQAVEELGLEGKVVVFGVLNLTPDNADKLLSPNSPLKSIIDQSGQEVGYRTLKNAISVLGGNITPYQFHLVNHRLFTQNDKEIIRKLLNETEQNSDSVQKSPAIKEENKPTQDTGVGSTKP